MRSFLLPSWLLLAVLLIPWCAGQSAYNFTHVLNDLIKVSPRVRPVEDPDTVTNISMSFNLLAIVHFDFVEQRLISNGWFTVTWRNEYTTWDSRGYANATTVSPDPSTVWRPDIGVRNTMKEMKPLGTEYVILTTESSGQTWWFPGEVLETFCRAEITYFPFDIQTCELVMFNWNGGPKQRFALLADEINLSSYTVNSEWEMLGTRAWLSYKVNMDTNNIHFSLTLRRRPNLLVLTVLLPVVVLATVNVFVFTIPSESGERLSYSMTALLSFGVFMNFIVDLMPSATEEISIVALHMSSLLMLSAVYVQLCILSLRLFHRDSSKHPVPGLLQTVVVWLEIIVCLDPPSKTNRVGDAFGLQADLDLALPNTKGSAEDSTSFSSISPSMKGLKLKERLDNWARQKKDKRELHAAPAEMTWVRVSRTADKLLFRFFLLLVVTLNLVVCFLLINNYYNSDCLRN